MRASAPTEPLRALRAVVPSSKKREESCRIRPNVEGNDVGFTELYSSASDFAVVERFTSFVYIVK